MTVSDCRDDRVLFEVDSEKRIATITLNNPKQRNSYDATMRDAIARYLDRVAEDDDLTVVLLRGADGVFSTGADMNNAYGWYGEQGAQGAAASETRSAKSGRAKDASKSRTSSRLTRAAGHRRFHLSPTRRGGPSPARSRSANFIPLW